MEELLFLLVVLGVIIVLDASMIDEGVGGGVVHLSRMVFERVLIFWFGLSCLLSLSV